MTHEEAARILRLCVRHGLPRPQRRPSMHVTGEYELRWQGERFEATVRTYRGAVHFCRVLFLERESGAV